MGNHDEIVVRDRMRWESLLASHEVEYQEDKKARESVIARLKRASPSIYREYLNARKKPCTHFYDYDMPDDFFIAYKDVTLPPLCGALAIHVIAMEGVKVQHDGSATTHCSIFEMDNPDGAYAWVPSYNNANQD